MSRAHNSVSAAAVVVAGLAAGAAWGQGGQWETVTAGERYYAAHTFNAAGDELGQFCLFATGDCVYAISGPLLCEEGEIYPALVTSDVGTVHAHLYCQVSAAPGQGGLNAYTLGAFEEVDRLVRRGSIFSVAIATETPGQFQVLRFSLSGSSRALDRMRASFFAQWQRQAPPAPAAPRDLI